MKAKKRAPATFHVSQKSIPMPGLYTEWKFAINGDGIVATRAQPAPLRVFLPWKQIIGSALFEGRGVGWLMAIDKKTIHVDTSVVDNLSEGLVTLAHSSKDLEQKVMSASTATVMDIAEDIVALLGHTSCPEFLEALGEACVMDDPDPNLVLLRDAVITVFNAGN